MKLIKLLKLWIAVNFIEIVSKKKKHYAKEAYIASNKLEYKFANEMDRKADQLNNIIYHLYKAYREYEKYLGMKDRKNDK